MKKELKQEWLDALRSGDFQQETGSLKYFGDTDCGSRYCCLGVLLEIEQLDGVAKHDFNFGDEELTSEELVRVGLDCEIHDEAIKRNDSGQSFEEIADWLEGVL